MSEDGIRGCRTSPHIACLIGDEGEAAVVDPSGTWNVKARKDPPKFNWESWLVLGTILGASRPIPD
jgi:hypothetical protein